MGHLRVTIGHLRVTVGHLRVTIGYLRVTIGFFSRSKHKANTTELHPKVRQTCFKCKEHFLENKCQIKQVTGKDRILYIFDIMYSIAYGKRKVDKVEESKAAIIRTQLHFLICVAVDGDRTVDDDEYSSKYWYNLIF